MKSFFSGYTGPIRIIRRYWNAYGGWHAFIRSPYLHLSGLLALALYPNWTEGGWWDTVISVVPSLVGFSLGGYAIWLALGDSDFRDVISGTDSDTEISPYMEVNSAFVHFIIMQLLALVVALGSKAFLSGQGYVDLIFSYFGYWLFIYAILCAAAATFAVLRVASWYDRFQSSKRDSSRGGRSGM